MQFPIDCSELSPCHADIYPQSYGDNVVNIDDLLAVIGAWGNCGGLPEDFPNGLMDCFNIYCDGLSGEEREICLEKCFEAYCIKFPDDC